MEKEYKINVDPRILELLGPNLYTNIYYVLAELIANAYDADAKNVYIISNKDDIRIEDDGHGMSYENGDVAKFLNVAGVSRTSDKDSYTRSNTRKKMGRKGVGKLAALSVSESVDVLTICNGEKSGFVLSRRPESDNKLTPIKDEDINFAFIKDSGTAIVMKNPQYRLHKSLDAIKRNLLKIFPLVDEDFKIHLIRGKEKVIVEKFDENIATELCSIIILGDQYARLQKLVPNEFPSHRSSLVEKRGEYSTPLTLKDNYGVEHEYSLQIEGWIGAYKSTRGRKAEVSDFPDNFISLYANKKLGEFNILPTVGQNKLNEVYVVGQLYIDLFELSELPDMALSNRQGYKSDDPRYEAVITYVRDSLLPDILNKRVQYANLKKAEQNEQKRQKQLDNEAKLKEMVDTFKTKASESAAIAIEEYGKQNEGQQTIKEIVSEAINSNFPELGLKTVVDSQKRRILISHTYADKDLADIVYAMLLHNNVPAEDILYTNCDDEVSRIPEGVSIYDYLRDFFVESYSNQKIFVLFITSTKTPAAWGAMTEIGAAWITQVDNKIFNIDPFKPQHPLNDEAVWHTTHRDDDKTLYMTSLNADIFCQKIEHACSALGYANKSRGENKVYLQTLITIK